MIEIKKQVQFEDIDIYGIIHHPKVLYYFERLRNLFFEQNGIKINEIEYGIILKKIKIDFKNRLKMFDLIIIRQIVNEIREYKFVLNYYILKNKKIMVYSQIEFITMNIKTNELIMLPEEIQNVLNRERKFFINI